MAKIARIVKDGRKMDYVATANVSNGDVVVVGKIIGVPHGNVAAGETVALDYTGTIEVPAKSDDTFNQGDIVFYDTSANQAIAAQANSEPIIGLVVQGKAGSTVGTIFVDLSVRD